MLLGTCADCCSEEANQILSKHKQKKAPWVSASSIDGGWFNTMLLLLRRHHAWSGSISSVAMFFCDFPLPMYLGWHACSQIR